MKIKITMLLALILVLLTFFVLGWNYIKNSEKDIFANKISSLLPKEIKVFLKKTVFLIPSLETSVNQKKATIKKMDRQIGEKSEIIEGILEQTQQYIEYYPFKKRTAVEKIKTNSSEYLLTKFSTGWLIHGKIIGQSSSYIDEYKNEIIIASGDGVFLYFSKKDLVENEFKARQIKSNIKKLVKYPEFYKRFHFGIKDLTIFKDKVFISYSNELEEDCFNTSILFADMNYKYLDFKEFFVPEDCVKKNNDYGEFHGHHSGGRIFPYKNNRMLFTVGDYRYRTHAQNDKNIFGKSLIIDIETAKWKILSKGHRNAQGLYYDSENDVILSTEHGPYGGDEINKIELGKNYGWPISSYGKHYKCRDIFGRDISDCSYIHLKDSPLHKSHSKFGFQEPIRVYSPGIGISELIKIPYDFSKNSKNNFFISAMGNRTIEGTQSIHHIVFDDNYDEILNEEIIFINERIRDIKYIKSINKVLMFLENSSSVGVLEKI